MFSFISIEGNIGSGKTSLARKIANDINGKLILEEFANNPFLPKFYKDPDKHAFSLELFFMAERYHQLSKENVSIDIFSNTTISDYSFFKSKLFAQNNLKDDELELFSRLYNIMFSSIRRPEILIYLHANIDRLEKNILKRGREYEKNIKKEYLKNIEKHYFDYLKKQFDFPVIILDVSNIDFIEDENIYKKIFKKIFETDIKKDIVKIIL